MIKDDPLLPNIFKFVHGISKERVEFPSWNKTWNFRRVGATADG